MTSVQPGRRTPLPLTGPAGHLLAMPAMKEEAAANLAQMRWKTSVPRTLVTRPFGATYVTIPVAATVGGLTKRPDQTVVALHCCGVIDVRLRDATPHRPR